MSKDLNFLSFNSFFWSLLIFIFFLLLEGIFHNYYVLISENVDILPYKIIAGYNPLIWHENGIVEILQAVILFISLIYITKFTVQFNKIVS